MKSDPHHTTLVFLCLLLFVIPALSQKKEPPKLFTESESLTGEVQSDKTNILKITGDVRYQITACNSDDTLVGILTYELTSQQRQRIAQILKIQIDELPHQIEAKDIIANYRKGTRCPILQLEFSAMELLVASRKVRLGRFTLNLKETKEPVFKYICAVARQIDRPLVRRSPCRRVNEILMGEDNQ